ncbi:hypothetical protein RAD15_42255, partial [Bradyrhizobium sp. 14AA]
MEAEGLALANLSVMAGLVPAIHGLKRARKARGCPGQAHGCPVQNYWTERMALILLDPGRLQAFRDTNGDQRH